MLPQCETSVSTRMSDKWNFELNTISSVIVVCTPQKLLPCLQVDKPTGAPTVFSTYSTSRLDSASASWLCSHFISLQCMEKQWHASCTKSFLWCFSGRPRSPHAFFFINVAQLQDTASSIQCLCCVLLYPSVHSKSILAPDMLNLVRLTVKVSPSHAVWCICLKSGIFRVFGNTLDAISD